MKKSQIRKKMIPAVQSLPRVWIKWCKCYVCGRKALSFKLHFFKIVTFLFYRLRKKVRFFQRCWRFEQKGEVFSIYPFFSIKVENWIDFLKLCNVVCLTTENEFVFCCTIHKKCPRKCGHLVIWTFSQKSSQFFLVMVNHNQITILTRTKFLDH